MHARTAPDTSQIASRTATVISPVESPAKTFTTLALIPAYTSGSTLRSTWGAICPHQTCSWPVAPSSARPRGARATIATNDCSAIAAAEVSRPCSSNRSTQTDTIFLNASQRRRHPCIAAAMCPSRGNAKRPAVGALLRRRAHRDLVPRHRRAPAGGLVRGDAAHDLVGPAVVLVVVDEH